MHGLDAANGSIRKLVIHLGGLSVLDEKRLRASLRRTTPSEPWVDAQIVEKTHLDDRGETIVRRMHDRGVFPPGGVKTRMVKCRACGVFTPPHAMEDGLCLDHREQVPDGPSPSAQAIAKIRYYNPLLVALDLPSEAPEDLEREIREFRESRRKRRKKSA